MTARHPIKTALTLIATAMAILVLPTVAVERPDQLPDPDGKAPDTSKPVKVYILAGQSNMLHMGNTSAGESGARIYRESDKPDARSAVNVSLYKGKYSPEKDYEKMEPAVTELFNVLGGCKDAKSAEQLSTIDGDFTRIATGFLEVPQTGNYSFYPGNRTNSIMTVDGRETYRKEPSKEEMTKRYIKLEAGKKYPFKAISLDGKISSHWRYHRKDTPGTLSMLVKEKGKFPYLLGKDGNWVERDDVFYQEARLNGAWNWDPNNPNKMLLDQAKLKASCKPLTVESNGIWVGVPFGFYLGDYYDEQVLLIRTAMGNRSLDWDFRPPSSGKLPDVREDLKKWEGVEYYMMVEGVHKTLDHIGQIVPNYKGQGYELAGFVWFQGHKDTFGTQDKYEKNLVNLINDIRSDFNTPKLPIVVATVAFGGREMQGNTLKVWETQMAVSGDKGKYPEFKDNVLSVDTRHAWREVEESPKNQGYHYNRNAETYTLIGESIAEAMIDLKERQKSEK